MKLKLSFKLFFVFLLINITSVSILVITNRHFSNWGFDMYVRYILLEKLEVLSQTLSSEYTKHGDWRFLSESPALWTSLVNDSWPVEDPNILILTPNIALSPASFSASAGADTGVERALPYPSKISLFDLNGNLVAGASYEYGMLGQDGKIPVTVDGKTVARLGISFGPQQIHPKDQELMRRQINTFNTVGLVTLLASTIVLFFFSKHLLAPIQQFSTAMKELTDRFFGTRIPVKRNDEFGVLDTSGRSSREPACYHF